MKKEFLIAVSTVILGSSLSYGESNIIADAREKMESISVDLAKGHFYVGGGVSYQSLNNDNTKEEFSTFGKNVIAGYQYGDYMAIEVRYSADIYKVDYTSGNTINKDNDDYPTKFTNVGIYAKGIYPLGDLAVYGLMGYGQLKITNVPEGDIARSVSSVQFGGGISYRLYDKVNLFGDYVILYDDTGFDGLATKSDMKSDIITVGFTYWF